VKRSGGLKRYRVFLFRWGVSTLIVGVGFGLVFFLLPQGNLDTIKVLSAVLVVGIAGLANGWIGNIFTTLADRSRLEDKIQDLESRVSVFQGRLDAASRFTRVLAEAEDERGLIGQMLKEVCNLVGAAGASYIPLDDWEQPLTTIQHGETPSWDTTTTTAQTSTGGSAWLASLGSIEVRTICGECPSLHTEVGSECPLGHNPFLKEGTIQCFRILRGQKKLGIINLYLPAGKTLVDDQRDFLAGLLGEMGIAIENLRMRSQELATLRQLQMIHGLDSERYSALSGLLAGISPVVEADWMAIFVRATHRHPARWILEAGGQDLASDDAVESLVVRVLEAGIRHQGSSTLYPNLMGLPIQAPGKPTLGVLLVGKEIWAILSHAQIRLLETVAAEAALVLESENDLLEVEYKAVIQERSRLAREIHDGLAQTLAYLKLQVSQMNNYLTRGDNARLKDALRSSLNALTEAYLDTRQAIDNLRLKPEEGLEHWLSQVAADFRQISQVETRVSIVEEPVNLAPEIQAQMIRVVQEALTNVRKHAQASQVSIILREWQGDYLLEIIDNGRGFLPDDIPGLSQYGLRGMRERAEMIGADFQIISQPNQGTTVRLRLPHPMEEEPV